MANLKGFVVRKKTSLAIFFFLLVCVLIKVFGFPVYEAETVIMVDIPKSPTSVDVEKVDLRENIAFIKVHMELLKSEPVLRSVVEDLKLFEDTALWKDMQGEGATDMDVLKEKTCRQAVESLREKHLSLASPVFTNLIELKVTYKDPEKAADIANTLVKNYIGWSRDFLRGRIDRTLEYLNAEVNKAEQRLAAAEDAYWKFEQENKIVSLPAEIQAAIASQAKFEADYIASGVEQRELAMRVEYIRLELAARNETDISTVSAVSHPLIQAIEAQLISLEVEMSRLKELYTEESPQVIYMRKRIGELKEKLKSTVEKIFASRMSVATVNPMYQGLAGDLIQSETMLIALGAKREAIANAVKDYADTLKDVPQEGMELARLMREVKINESLYTFLVQEQEKARLLRVKETPEHIKIISAAVVPLKAKGTVINLLGGILISLLFAIGLPVLFEHNHKPLRQ